MSKIWTPKHLREDEIDEETQVNLKIKSFVNRLTPDNNESICYKMSKILTPEFYPFLLESIFTASCENYNYINIYIIMIQKIYEKDKSVRKIILSECKKRFDNMNHESSKKYMLGNIKFISELIVVDIIPPKIAELCLKKLINEDLVHIECSCMMLETLKDKINSDEYINKLKSLKIEDKRTKFMILDLEELKERNWVYRMKKEEAKKINL